MKKLLFISLLFVVGFGGYGQNPEIKRTWHWYFGLNAGIDFTGGSGSPDLNSDMFADESCATISDTSGNLLFYTDGILVWDVTHDTMANGFDLAGCASTTQGSLVVPKPNSDSHYYIFTADCIQNGYLNGYTYSEVDMTLNGGLGDVISATKNTLLYAPSTEKLTAVNHCNGQDVWVITHALNSNEFYSYLVSDTGVGTPVISGEGLILDNESAMGEMKASPDGSKIAFATGTIISVAQVATFNNITGVVSDSYTLFGSDTAISTYGISFSPNSDLLYVEERTYANLVKIWQYDLTAGDSVAIQNSKIVIGTVGDSLNINVQIAEGPLELAPDGKIYHATYDITLGTVAGDYLSVIHQPDSPGLTCNFIQEDFYLGGQLCYISLPNFNQSYFGTDTCINTSIIEVNREINETSSVYPNPSTGIFTVQGTVSIIQVYDLFGRLVLETPNKEIDMSSYPAGLYIWSVGEARGKVVIE